MLFRVIFLLTFFHATTTHAERPVFGPVLADVVKVRDGDSVDVIARPWPGQHIRVSVRLRGIDAPELRGKCNLEKRRAIVARDRLIALLQQKTVRLRQISGGKYFGRVLARVETFDGMDVQKILLREKLVRPYRGKKRKSWCFDQHG